MTSSSHRVDTKSVKRRELCLQNLEDVLAEAGRIGLADVEGQLTCRGNWSAGQVFGHVAFWIHAAFDGLPFRVPWFLRLIGPMLRGYAIGPKLPAGIRLSSAPDGTWGTDPLSTQEGADALYAAVHRLIQGPPSAPHPLFGRLSHEQWKTLHIRHAELHFSFLEIG